MSDKIKPHHLARKAILYVRQSSTHHVLHSRESQALQYAMRERERWTRVAGPEEDARKVKAAPLPPQMGITFCGCWPCGVVGDAAASSKRSGKSTGLTSAAHTAAGVW
jgi:hypothetical protein